jgi:transcriptional regulator with XRE-family HTH domain
MDKDALKKFRESIGLTQSDLADALSVANNTVSRWELGTRAIPSFLPLALETIERNLSKVKGESTVGSSDISASTNEKPIKGLPDEYNLTVKDVGKLLDRSPRQVRTYAERGELRGEQGKQNHWFFRQMDVDDYIQSRI